MAIVCAARRQLRRQARRISTARWRYGRTPPASLMTVATQAPNEAAGLTVRRAGPLQAGRRIPLPVYFSPM